MWRLSIQCWNKGSLDGSVKFDFTVKTADGSTVASFPSLPSTGNMDEQQGRIQGSTYHSLEFDIPEEGDYTVTYSMTSGWSAVIVGNLRIATAMSTAERYKGTFQRTLKEARALYQSLMEENLDGEDILNLIETIHKYDDLVSTSPSVYEKAIAELADAIAKASSLAVVQPVDAGIISQEYLNLQGQRIDPSSKGVVIVMTRRADGSCEVAKTIR